MKLIYKDQQHAYYLDGKRCKSVTAVAKIPDDTYNLNQWQKRQVLVGVAARPELIERVAAHFDDKDTLNAVAEEALVAARAHTAADRGTAWHRITERHDLAEEMIETPQSKAIREAWQKALDAAGLEVIPEYVERIIVYPDMLLCGKFDRIMRRKADGRFVIVDLKTGENAVRYPHAIAVQEGIYANAPLLAGPIGGQSGATETFTELPEPFDRSLGYVVHMPDPEHVEVVGVDIEAGWNVARNICFPVLDWRKRGDLVFPLPAVTINPSTEGEKNAATGDHVDGDRVPGVPDAAPVAGESAAAAPVEADPDGAGREAAPPVDRDARRRAHSEARLAVETPGTPEHHAIPAERRYEWLRARLKTIIDAGHGQEVVVRWPADTPTLKNFEHDDAALDRIAELLGHVEKQHTIPFGPNLADFTPADPVEVLAEAFPGSTVVAVATDEQKKPYANWLRQIVAADPTAGDRITADLDSVGLRKSLSRDQWTPDELKTLDGILRRAERAALTAPGATHTQQQLAS